MSAVKALLDRMREQNTLVSCGLDPDLSKMPLEITAKKEASEAKAFEFLKDVIDITARHVCNYKANKAFFDVFDDGRKLLHNVIRYAHSEHPGIPVFVDAKVGDTENTLKAYMSNILGDLEADGIMLNPYMGDDVFAYAGDYKDKALLVLVRTSNAGSYIIQDVPLANGMNLWEHVLDLAVNRWNSHGNLIPILSSTVDIDYRKARKLIPDNMPILLAGYGAQKGSLSQLDVLLNSERSGVFINSSRLLLYPYEKEDREWREKIKDSVTEMKKEINSLLKI